MVENSAQQFYRSIESFQRFLVIRSSTIEAYGIKIGVFLSIV